MTPSARSRRVFAKIHHLIRYPSSGAAVAGTIIGGLIMDRDFWFYRRRATEESWAAKRAITASARERHEALARSFRERLERMEEGELLTEA